MNRNRAIRNSRSDRRQQPEAGCRRASPHGRLYLTILGLNIRLDISDTADRRMKLKSKLFFLLILGGVLGAAAPAYAYLDPGTGSMLVQLLLGGVAGALVIGKLYWSRFKDLFSRQRPQGDAEESPSNPDVE